MSLEIIIQELEKFLLMESWTQMVELLLTMMDKKLKEFASVNYLKITNTFFRHKEIHNMKWSARNYRSIRDYILMRQEIFTLRK